MFCDSSTRLLANTDALLFPSQIEFLNSVIVDLQRKNEDLKDKLEKMAAAALNGNSPSELDNYDGWVFLLPLGLDSHSTPVRKQMHKNEKKKCKFTDAVADCAFHISAVNEVIFSPV